MAIPRPPGPLSQLLTQLVAAWDYIDELESNLDDLLEQVVIDPVTMTPAVDPITMTLIVH